MITDKQKIDKQRVANSFGQAAKTYDAHAFLQKEVAERVFERLSCMKVKPKMILDAGCGTGLSTRQLKKKFSSANIFGIDIAQGMIEQAKESQSWFKKINYQVADIDALPFESNQFDLVFSNLTIQWLPELKKTFGELNRVLKPGGLLIFSTLGPDTLMELKKSWQATESSSHVNEFIDMHIVGDEVFKNNFENVVMDRDIITLTYKTMLGLMKDLKAIGSHAIDSQIEQKRSADFQVKKGLLGKQKFEQAKQAYEKFRNSDNCLPATYEVIYGHAWKSNKDKKLDYHTQSVKVQAPQSN